jgi:hypothetical protein
LLVKYSETYRIYVEAFKSSEFSVYLNGTMILENRFDTTNENSLPQNAYFSSADLDLVGDQMLSLEIRYAEKLGDSKIRLFWESDSQAFELI